VSIKNALKFSSHSSLVVGAAIFHSSSVIPCSLIGGLDIIYGLNRF
jgi:hypothetical protein